MKRVENFLEQNLPLDTMRVERHFHTTFAIGEAAIATVFGQSAYEAAHNNHPVVGLFLGCAAVMFATWTADHAFDAQAYLEAEEIMHTRETEL